MSIIELLRFLYSLHTVYRDNKCPVYKIPGTHSENVFSGTTIQCKLQCKRIIHFKNANMDNAFSRDCSVEPVFFWLFGPRPYRFNPDHFYQNQWGKGWFSSNFQWNDAVNTSEFHRSSASSDGFLKFPNAQYCVRGYSSMSNRSPVAVKPV